MKKRLLKSKSPPVIQVIGTINEEAFAAFSKSLRVCEESGIKKVTLELSSGGGVAYDALSFYNRMRHSSVEIIVLAYGLVASAAVLILAAGDKRLMTSEAWLMVHEDSTSELSAKVTNIEKEAKHLRAMEEQWNLLLELHSNTSSAAWEDYSREETYFTSSDCLTLGIIDEIII